MKTITREEAIQMLKDRLLTNVPPEFVKERVSSIHYIYNHRSALKRIPGSDATIAHVAGIIADTIRLGNRFRTLDCLKVLRSLVQNPEIGEPVGPATIKVLFEIYEHFIFDDREEVQWCVSAIIKDKPLDDEAVEWLLANRNRSEHIVNRLLLYPVRHPKIQQWAKQTYLENSLSERQYQVLALLIEDDFPEYTRKEDTNTLVWAIFKSRMPDRRKVELINKYSDLDSVESVVKIADQIGSTEIMVRLLQKLEANAPAN